MRISIHTLRMEGDPSMPGYVNCKIQVFQSTPSAWRVTFYIFQGCFSTAISIHTLRMEGDHFTLLNRTSSRISIHTLRMEGDWIYQHWTSFLYKFQSTPSAWRVTVTFAAGIVSTPISIHTLRMEGDYNNQGQNHLKQHFNPHPPHGG